MKEQKKQPERKGGDELLTLVAALLSNPNVYPRTGELGCVDIAKTVLKEIREKEKNESH